MKKKAFHQDGDEMSANAPDYHKTSGKLNDSLPLIAHVVIILRDVTNYHCHISPHKKAQYCSCTTESPTLTVIRCIFFIQASGFSRARCCLNYWSLHSLSIKSSVIHREGGGMHLPSTFHIHIKLGQDRGLWDHALEEGADKDCCIQWLVLRPE